ncbi:HDOD domain-containing protein [Shewanella amazonensis]|uniref:Putative signal transduction protein n=2 Tax=Shewanella amazonensis (strain ATCC BAA-1098 / SB2B) TaxID=326297 RepID=A1SBA1_SHEAM|nr:HDOD domain-containing protein [Shewanella amazonensis]ABM01658.1 putative signal transduction protein [Shewanella amazonensis SB2B]
MHSAALLQKVDELPRLPKAIAELLDVVNNEDSTVKAVSEKLSHDPVLSARVLRLANSARFGCSREVGTIDDAVVRLGMQTLRTLVIASAVVGAVPKVEGFDLADFWGNTFEVAIICQELAKRLGTLPEEAFTCGILHSIGELLIVNGDPAVAATISAAVADGADRNLMEKELLGYDNAEIGALLAQSWKFTPHLVKGIQFQNHPKSAEPYSKLAGMLAMAKQIAADWDKIPDDERTSWLAQINILAGIKVDLGGLAEKLAKMHGQGMEMGKQLA